MVCESKNTTENEELLKHSTLYQEFLAEREEILKHKWYESEKAGHDVGFEWALTDWIIKHRAKWKKHRENLRRQQEEERKKKNKDKDKDKDKEGKDKPVDKKKEEENKQKDNKTEEKDNSKDKDSEK